MIESVITAVITVAISVAFIAGVGKAIHVVFFDGDEELFGGDSPFNLVAFSLAVINVFAGFLLLERADYLMPGDYVATGLILLFWAALLFISTMLSFVIGVLVGLILSGMGYLLRFFFRRLTVSQPSP